MLELCSGEMRLFESELEYINSLPLSNMLGRDLINKVIWLSISGMSIKIVANETITNEEYTTKTHDDLLALYLSARVTTKPSNIYARMTATRIGTTVDKRIYVISVIDNIISANATWFGSVRWDSYHSLKNLNINNLLLK